VIDYALGEVQTRDTPVTRHAVADAKPSTWSHAICSAGPLVWAHEIAGDPIPFPGPMGEESACRECIDLVVKAMSPKPPPHVTHPMPEWLRDFLRRWR
jgi:hypothetical protein